MISNNITLNIAFIGAGGVNFGGAEGPWNHCKRIEQITKIPTKNNETLNIAYNVIGIVDPFVERAQQILENQRKITLHPEMWRNTQIYSKCSEMIEKNPKIDATWIGVPPDSHGSTQQSIDVEYQLAKIGSHLFIEKPISCYPMPEVENLYKELNNLITEKNLIISVGYMFRYSKAIAKIQEIIKEHGTPRMFVGKYNCAYSKISKKEWWDNEKCGGPIVEQGTHFCDLARFLMGDVDLPSIQAYSIFENEALGTLQDQCENVKNYEKNIDCDRRIARATVANFRFKSGALGNFVHGVLLHGENYESELEIWGDGYRCKLIDPYKRNILNYRIKHENEKEILFGELGEDVYLEENKAFLESIACGDKSKILSSYGDAMDTYRLTWAIRNKTEENKYKCKK